MTDASAAAGFEYFAFISYSRKDSAVARWLQRNLEWFRFPTDLVDPANSPPHPKYLRPVVRDKNDLEVDRASFWEDIQRKIDGSRFLIVLCSKAASGSQYVNKEIEHFLQNPARRSALECVLPVIIDGNPGSGDQSECLPPALRLPEVLSRNHPTMVPDEGERLKEAWESGLIQVVAYLLQVSRAKIANRYERAKRQQLRRTLATVCALLLVFAAMTIWAVLAERKAARNAYEAVLARKDAEQKRDLADEAKRQADENLLQAKAAQRRASDNFLQARQAVQDFVSQVQQERAVFSQPGVGKVRDALLSIARKHYQDFSTKSGSTIAERAEIAEAAAGAAMIQDDLQEASRLLGQACEYRRQTGPEAGMDAQAELALAMDCANLGKVSIRLKQPERATGQLEEAIGIYQRLSAAGDGLSHLRRLSSVYRDLSAAQAGQKKKAEAVESLRQAVAAQDKVVKANPKDVESCQELVTMYKALAALQLDNEQAEPAAESLAQAATVARSLVAGQPADTSCLALSLSIHHKLGDLQVQLKQPEQAAASYQQAMEASRAYGRLQLCQNGQTGQLVNDQFVTAMDAGQVAVAEEDLAVHRSALPLVQQLARQHPDDRQRQSDLARVLYELALLQGRAGNMTEAQECSLAALTICQKLAGEQPGDESLQAQLADVLLVRSVHLGLANREAEGLECVQKALSIRQRLADARPQDVQRLRDLAEVHRLLSARDSGAGMEHYEKALKLWEGLAESHRDDPQVQYGLARCLYDRFDHLGQDDRATLVLLRKGLAIFEKLAEANPQVRELQLELATCCDRCAFLHNRLNERQEVLAMMGKAAEARKRLGVSASTATFDPESGNLLSCRGNSQLRIVKSGAQVSGQVQTDEPGRQEAVKVPTPQRTEGDRLAEAGQADQAMAQYREALRITQALVDEHKAMPLAALELGILHGKMADVQMGQGQADQARHHREQAIGILEKIQDEVTIRSMVEVELGVALEKVGDMLANEGDRNGALARYNASLEYARRAVAHDPGNAKTQRELSVSLGRFGDMRMAVEDGAGAQSYYSEMVDIRRKLVAAARPASPEARQDLAVSLAKQGQAYGMMRQFSRANAAYEAAINEGTKLQEEGRKHPMVEQVLATSYAGLGDIARGQRQVREALMQYRQAARHGNSYAMACLGAMYGNGEGVSQDDDEAAKWLRQAAAAGNPQGMGLLGLLYADGRGVEQDSVKAAKWYTAAAKAGDPAAMNRLGVAYMKGRGVERDVAKAVQWLLRGADAGEPAAMANAGMLYAEGIGVRRDGLRAVEWMRKAAAAGNQDAIQWLQGHTE